LTPIKAEKANVDEMNFERRANKPIPPIRENAAKSECPDFRSAAFTASGYTGRRRMTHEIEKKSPAVMSRRSLLQIAAAAGAVPVLALGASPAAAKMSQSGVSYQDSPHGSSNCANCKLFIAPSSCKTVEGTVSPNGWCKIWVKA
jgi:hypothetical protein